MLLTVRLFALAKERAGRSELAVELCEGANVGDLKNALADASESLRGLLPSLMIAINTEYALDSDLVPQGAEIAAIPPVSGGSFGPMECR